MNENFIAYVASEPKITEPNKHDQPEGYGLLALLFFFGLIFYLAYIAPYLDWKKLPPLSLYLAKNPDCLTKAGVRCNNCGSRSLKNWGQRHAIDRYRVHICNSCGRKLYRSQL